MGIRRRGIFGGTFNPIHMGHLTCCEEVRSSFNLENVIFIPSATPPHKESSEIISASYRYKMVKLGINENTFFEVSNIEMRNTGKSYSINTVFEFKSIFGEKVTLFFIIGLDAFLELETWKDPEELITLCHFIVMLRPGFKFESINETLPNYIKDRIVIDVEKEYLINYNNPEKNVILFPVPGIDLSSTLLRNKLRNGESIKYQVPSNVENFIFENNLYIGETK